MAPVKPKHVNAAPTADATMLAVPSAVTEPDKEVGKNTAPPSTDNSASNTMQAADRADSAGNADASADKKPLEPTSHATASNDQSPTDTTELPPTAPPVDHLETYALYTFMPNSGSESQYRLDLVPLSQYLLERPYDTARLEPAMEHLLLLQPGECALMIQQANDREGTIVWLQRHADTHPGDFGNVPNARSLTFIVKTTLPALKSFSRSGLLSQIRGHVQFGEPSHPQEQNTTSNSFAQLVQSGFGSFVQAVQPNSTSSAPVEQAAFGGFSDPSSAELLDEYSRPGPDFGPLYTRTDHTGHDQFQSILPNVGYTGVSSEELRLKDYQIGRRFHNQRPQSTFGGSTSLFGTRFH